MAQSRLDLARGSGWVQAAPMGGGPLIQARRGTILLFVGAAAPTSDSDAFQLGEGDTKHFTKDLLTPLWIKPVSFSPGATVVVYT